MLSRREDVLPMARHYLSFFERRQGRQNLDFSIPCEQAITSHAWPDNLRELRNAVERAVILCPSSVIEATDLGIDLALALAASLRQQIDRYRSAGDDILASGRAGWSVRSCSAKR